MKSASTAWAHFHQQKQKNQKRRSNKVYPENKIAKVTQPSSISRECVIILYVQKANSRCFYWWSHLFGTHISNEISISTKRTPPVMDSVPVLMASRHLCRKCGKWRLFPGAFGCRRDERFKLNWKVSSSVTDGTPSVLLPSRVQNREELTPAQLQWQNVLLFLTSSLHLLLAVVPGAHPRHRGQPQHHLFLPCSWELCIFSISKNNKVKNSWSKFPSLISFLPLSHLIYLFFFPCPLSAFPFPRPSLSKALL